MIKILFNDKRIYLTRNAKEFIDQQAIFAAHILFSVTKQKLTDLLDEMLVSDINDSVIEGDPQTTLDLIAEYLKLVVAAGGIVVNEYNEILFIFRKKKWDLPKGKIDPNEHIEDCAIREVQEETGVRNLQINSFLTVTYHIYLENNYLLKETHWYMMSATKTRLYPQREEGITKAVWSNRSLIKTHLYKTYESIRDVSILALRTITKHNQN